jgi:hypothetical protein
MSDPKHHDDEDTNAFFAEVEKEKKNDYETCSASQAFDAVFQCYSKFFFLFFGSHFIKH